VFLVGDFSPILEVGGLQVRQREKVVFDLNVALKAATRSSVIPV
jgi:hypothetical protein